jgi:hypothetical protein
MGTTKTVKPELEHKDKLGRIIKVGDTVCYPSRNSLEFGTVKKLNNKMVKVWEAGVRHSTYYKGSNKYPNDVVIVEGPEVSMYLLRMTAKNG